MIIFVVASGLAAAVVWWASSPPDPPRATARARRRNARALSIRDTFQPTGPDLPAELERSDGFVISSGVVPDERPPRLLSIIRIVLTIAVVAAVGVAAIGGMVLLVKLQLDRYFVGGP